MDYFVVLYRRQDDRRIAARPVRMDSMIAAVGAAQHLAQEAAGALVFARGVGRRGAEIEIVFRTGDVPEGVPDVASG